MVYDVIIRKEAEKDLAEIFLWYEDKRIGLGHDFLLQVDAGLHYIVRNPMTHEVVYKSVRIYLTKRFPYKIVYIVNEKKVIVLGVFHASRGAMILRNRIKNI